MTPPGGRRRVPRDRRAAAGARRAPVSRRSRRRARSALRWSSWVSVAVVVVLVSVAALSVDRGDGGDRGPSAPVRVTVTSEDTTATAIWDRTPSASFHVQYSEDLDFTDEKVEEVDRNRLDLQSLVPGTTYFLRVASVVDGKVSRPSRPVRFTTGFRYPAPTLVVDSTTSSSLVARWTGDAKKVRYQAQLDSDEEFGSPRTSTVKTRRATFKRLKRTPAYSVRVRVVDRTGTALSPWSEPERRKTARLAPLRVGTWNVLKASKGGWPARRVAVADTIRSQDLDVVGLQEATPARVAGGLPQFADIVRALGPDWALTQSSRGATGEARTVYNRKRLELVKQGYEAIPGSTRFGVLRYITWAVFEQKSTGKQFVFLNTHFVTSKARSRFGPRAAAAAQLVRLAQSVSGGKLPVVIGGDFNSAAPRSAGNGVYRNITAGGYIDPLARTGKLGAAEKLVNADLKTVNKLARRPQRDASAPMIDHMFVSRMRVTEWETVARLDANGNVIGTIPSDHNMIRLTVFLP